MNVALLAPSYVSIHGSVLEPVRRHIVHILNSESPESGDVRNLLVLDQAFWSRQKTASTVQNRLQRARIHALFLLVRYGQSLRMRLQIDAVISSLFQPRASIPIMPLCVFFHGVHPVNRTEKQRIKSLFKTYLSQQPDIPNGMFTDKMIQVRHCYSKFLREDKIANVLEWMLEQTKDLARWSSFVPNGIPQQSSSCTVLQPKRPARSPGTLRSRRSFSEPRVIPVTRGYATVVCEEARHTVNLSFRRSLLKTALTQLARNEKPWIDLGAIYDRAEYLHRVFGILTSSRDRIYENLNLTILTLKDQDSYKPRKRELFFTHFGWLVESWRRRVSHAVIRCEIGSVGHVQIFRFTDPLDMEELRLMRACILDHFASYEKPKKKTAENLPSGTINRDMMHRSHSMHDFRQLQRRRRPQDGVTESPRETKTRDFLKTAVPVCNVKQTSDESSETLPLKDSDDLIRRLPL